MAGTRQITYASLSDMAGGKVVYSDAKTWGELKGSEPDIFLKSQKMKPWVKGADETGHGRALQSDDALLPEGNFTLTFILDKNDSGYKLTRRL